MLSYFPDGWHDDVAFVSTAETEQDTLRGIRCCLHSEQCDMSKKDQEEIDCSSYVEHTSDERALLGAELYVVRTLLCKGSHDSPVRVEK